MKRFRIAFLCLSIVIIPAGLAFFFLNHSLGAIFDQGKAARLLNEAIPAAYSAVLPCSGDRITDPNSTRKLEMAVLLLKRAVENDPRFSQSYLLLGRAFCWLGRYDEAVGAYQEYARWRPANPLGYLEAGFGYEKLGDVQNSLKQWDLAGLSPQYLFDVGLSAHQIGNLSQARHWYKRASLMHPGWNSPLLQIAVTHQEQNDIDSAIRILQEGIQQSRDKTGLSNLYYLLGFLFQYNQTPRDLDTAWTAYEMALQIDDFSLSQGQKAATYHHRGSIMVTKNQLDQAANEYQTAINLDPKQYWARLGLASVLWRKGEDVRALQLVNEAIQLNARPSFAYIYFGDYYLYQGDIYQSKLMYEKALEIDPMNERAMDAISEIEKLP